MEERGFVALEEGRESNEEGEGWGEVDYAPFEWVVWGWREFHPEAVERQEAAKGAEGEGWIDM